LLEAGINSPDPKVVEGDPVTLNLLLETIGVDGRSVDRAIEVVYSVHPETGMANYCVLNTYGAEAYEAPITAAEFDTLWALTKQPIPVFGKAHHAQNTYSHQLTVSDIAASVTYRRWAGVPAVGWQALGAIASAMEQLAARVKPVERKGRGRRPTHA
jgi:hypothetical protein